MNIFKTDPDLFLHYTKVFIIEYKGKVYSTCLALLSGMAINTLSDDKSSETICKVYSNIFGITGRPLNIISWIALGLIFSILICEKLLIRYLKKKSLDLKYYKFLQEHTDLILQPFFNKISWGSCVTLDKAPDLYVGFGIRKIKIKLNSGFFSLSEIYKVSYSQYFKKNYDEKRLFDDGPKFMLSSFDRTFSDTNTFVLELKNCYYSEVQFFKDEISSNKALSSKFIKNILKNEPKINFPNALCLHLIIVTSDKKVLVTKRTMASSYNAGKWSISVEEQLANEDFNKNKEIEMANWVSRLLFEELAIEKEDFNLDNFRILSLFFESDILNCSLCGLIKFDFSSDELKSIIEARSKTDSEFDEFNFYNYDDITSELVNPTKDYHPSSGYRSLMLLYHEYGIQHTRKKIMSKYYPVQSK